MLELIERIEPSTEGSRELDGEILCSVFGFEKRDSDTWGPYYFKGTVVIDVAYCYTSRVDDAIRLIPDRWGYSINVSECRKHVTVKLGRSHPTNKNTFSEAKTLPLAICAAALKAREIDKLELTN
jgi:hypothetical protein